MATLADAFLADLEDLEDASEHEEEPPREDAAGQEVSAASTCPTSKASCTSLPSNRAHVDCTVMLA